MIGRKQRSRYEQKCIKCHKTIFKDETLVTVSGYGNFCTKCFNKTKLQEPQPDETKNRRW